MESYDFIKHVISLSLYSIYSNLYYLFRGFETCGLFSIPAFCATVLEFSFLF